MCHQEIFVGQWFWSGSIRIVRRVHQVYVQLFSEIPVTRVAHLEEVSCVIHQGSLEDDLHGVGYDTHEDATGFHALFNLTHRLMKEVLRLKHVVQGKVVTHDIVPPIGTRRDVTVIKVDPVLESLGPVLRLLKRRRVWFTHVQVDTDVPPFLKISTETTTHVEYAITGSGYPLDESTLLFVVIPANLFHVLNYDENFNSFKVLGPT
jgi:hypothetical protein